MADETIPSRDTSSRKRDQVQKAQRTMFFWVAGMSVVVGFSVVVVWFLWQQLAFRTVVVNKKNDTVSTLEKNNQAVPKLKDNLRVLEANEALQSAKANADERAIQVILDALPSENNSLALGASVQNRLASDIPGLTIETLNTNIQQTSSKGSNPAGTAVPFRITVSSTDINMLKELLVRFERSIRVIDIDMLALERSAEKYTMTVDAHAYYEPAKSVELQVTTVKPGSKQGGKR